MLSIKRVSISDTLYKVIIVFNIIEKLNIIMITNYHINKHIIWCTYENTI